MKKSESTGVIRSLLPSLSNMFRGPQINTNLSKTESDEDNVAYLNVHAGVSMGLMAGIDIGANDRWEFFLVGEPLSKVAVAESLADTGEVVLSPEAHEIMHPSTPIAKKAARRASVSSLRLRMNREPSLSKMFIVPEPIELPSLECGCERKGNGFCAMNRSRSPTAGLKKSRTKAKIDMSVMLDETFINDSKLLESVEDDADTAHLAATDRLTRAVDAILENQRPQASVAATERNSTTNLPSNGRGLTVQLTPLSPLSRTMSFNLSTTPKMASMRGMGMSSRRLLDIQDPN
eukprot:gene31962-39484_t